VHVVVVQGEHDTVGENRLIGSFMFDLEQPCPKGTRCEIQLTYDVNGMVHVFARQLGTHNEARAHFDSRTGEVKGWTPVGKTKSPPVAPVASPASVSAEPSAAEAVEEPRPPQNLVTLGFARAVPGISLDGSLGNEEQPLPSVMNSLIMRAQRYMAQAGAQAADYNMIQNATQNYIHALERTRQGALIDEEVESLEEALLSLLEGK
jgi:molecular chaperone DnaK